MTDLFQYAIAILGVGVVCAGWVLLQSWIVRRAPDVPGIEGGCYGGGCGGAGCGVDKTPLELCADSESHAEEGTEGGSRQPEHLKGPTPG